MRLHIHHSVIEINGELNCLNNYLHYYTTVCLKKTGLYIEI